MSFTLLLLIGGGSTQAQEGNTRRCVDLLNAKKVVYETLDGSVEANREQ